MSNPIPDPFHPTVTVLAGVPAWRVLRPGPDKERAFRKIYTAARLSGLIRAIHIPELDRELGIAPGTKLLTSVNLFQEA